MTDALFQQPARLVPVFFRLARAGGRYSATGRIAWGPALSWGSRRGGAFKPRRESALGCFACPALRAACHRRLCGGRWREIGLKLDSSSVAERPPPNDTAGRLSTRMATRSDFRTPAESIGLSRNRRPFARRTL